MKQFKFEHPGEFSSVFFERKREVTDAIVLGIEKAIYSNKKTAQVFEVAFESADAVYEISLPRVQWEGALEKCLEFYKDQELADEQIDTWKLIQTLKTWQK